MTEVSTVTLEAGLSLSYAEQGDRRDPLLVLLPGPTDSWRSYEPVLERLPPSIGAIAVSQRGHGESDKPVIGYRVEDFAADVVPLLDALGVARAVLAGHSGSCLVARRVAIDRPDRVAGLVLEASPTTLGGDPGLEGFVESVVWGLEDPVDPDFARSFVVDTSSGVVGHEVVDQLVAELLKVPARVWREMFAGLLPYDDMADLGRINAPALLVWGGADALVTGDMQDQLAERIAGAESVVCPGVGHTRRWERPSRFRFRRGCRRATAPCSPLMPLHLLLGEEVFAVPRRVIDGSSSDGGSGPYHSTSPTAGVGCAQHRSRQFRGVRVDPHRRR